MEKERQEALQWFVSFGNLDLRELKPGDKAKFLIEAEEYLSPTKELEKIPFIPSKAAIVASKSKKNIDQHIKSELKEMSWATKEQSQKDSNEYWDKIRHLQDVIKDVLQLPGFFFDSKREREIQLSPGIRTLMWRGQLMISMEATPEKFNLSYIPITGGHGEYIRLKFYRLLDGLPRSTISKCPGCNKFFLNTSLRKKRFCSSRCLWRINAEKRRKADPEGYREKQREIMKRRYEKLQRAKGYKKISHYKKES